MAQWNDANLGGFIPPELNTIVSGAQAVTSSASTVLGTVQTTIDAISSVLVPIPGFDFLGSLKTLVENFRNDFLATGIYACNMWEYPLKQLYRSGSGGEAFSKFENDLSASFSDTKDANVPPFTSACAMLILVGGAPGLPGVIPVIKGAAAAFSWWEELQAAADQTEKASKEEDSKDVVDKLKSGEVKEVAHPSQQTQKVQQAVKAVKDTRDNLAPDDVPDAPASTSAAIDAWIAEVTQSAATSTYPDWGVVSLRTINPAFVNIVDKAFQPLIDSLETGRDIVATLTAFIAVIEAKIDALDKVITEIDGYLDDLNALASATGLYALYVESTTGIDGLIAEMNSAESKPFDGLTNGFYFGTALVGGGPSLIPFKNLFSLIGG